MHTNDQIILDQILDQRRQERAPGTTESAFFEFFTAEQALKDFDLSYDEIDSGLVGDGGDGGIDGMYVLVNNDLVQEDDYAASLKADVTLDLVFLQAKRRRGFEDTPVERFITSSEDILDLSKGISEITSTYNSGVLDVISRFRAVHQRFVRTFPKLRITYYYACRARSVGGTVENKVPKLQDVVKKHFPDAEFRLEFLDAPRLLSLARRLPKKTYKLTLAENPISSANQVGFACLVRLRAFYDFITDEGGVLQRQIFEANVRDHQGRTEVNREIQNSLRHPNSEDFWWLNNGISIVATQASLGGKTLTIKDPQIVNGLQTSTEIYNYFKSLAEGLEDERSKTDIQNGEERNILVRVMVPDDTGSRDRIIRATNSQTAVQLASLRATDKIHRDIEEYFKSHDLYYDRRKNYYKNRGKPRDKIVGIPYLAQSVMAIVLQRPDTARARPSSLLKKDDDYRKIYDERHPINLYYVCAAGMRRVEEFLKEKGSELSRKDRNNLRFYVGMHAVGGMTESGGRSPSEVAGIDVTQLSDVAIERSFAAVTQAYGELGGTDQVAKGPDLRKTVLTSMEKARDLARGLTPPPSPRETATAPSPIRSTPAPEPASGSLARG